MLNPIRAFWKAIHMKYGNPSLGRLSVPMQILANFDYHYFMFNDNGDVVDGARSLREAIQKHKSTGLYLVHVIENR